MGKPFQSTPPVRGATNGVGANSAVMNVSIHAPREGSDILDRCFPPASAVSIHAPREGSDEQLADLTPEMKEFQSTPPVRGATIHLRNSKGDG